MDDYHRFRRLLENEPLPAALVDLDAVEHNARLLLDRLARDVTLRVATKSVRHTGLLRQLMELGGDRFRGLMCYSAREAAWLADQGWDDLLVAYPFARPDEAALLARLAAEGRTVRAMVDHPDQVALLDQAARAASTVVPVCLDVDVSWRPGPGIHLGVRRSPVRSVEDALRVAGSVGPGTRLDAVMAYEAQVAGLHDSQPPWERPVIRVLKRRSRALAARRRREVVEALRRAGHPISLVNGGGTGSIASTSHDGSVTEVTAGSGFLCPHLFDGYVDLPLRPAAFFALPVVRSSDPGFVTCLGGGYVASGQAGADRLPVVHLPQGLRPVELEGWGEVQTPLRVTAGRAPDLGDPVICRHAKAGELAERFDRYLLFRDDQIVAREPTYRGEGQCFL